MEQTGVIAHAVCVMSNHWHGVVFDPEGRLPEFLERFHRLVARAVNASLGHCENLWSNEKTNAIALLSAQDVLDRIAYTIANPTAAGLVRSPLDWPGVISHRFGESALIEKPDVFFDDDGDLPEEVDLQFTRPSIFLEMSDAAVARQVQAAVAQRIRVARKDLQLKGQKFLGREAVLRQPFLAMPKTVERRGTRTPRVASKSSAIRVEAIRRMLEFLRSYRVAWLAWRAGNREVMFPFGTYALRIYAGVRCAEPPP